MRTKVVLLVVAGLSVTAPALADRPPPEDSSLRAAAARDGGEEGLRHFAAGRLIEAYESFQRADALFHAPTLVLYMAHSRRRLGKLASARALYQRVVDERIPKTAPLQFLTAQAVAREELDHLERRVPFIELTLTGGYLPVARLTVDGAAAPAVASQLLPLDPGDHVLEVRFGEGGLLRRIINLKEGATLKLAITLPEPPPSPSAVMIAPPAPEPPAAPPARGPLAPAVVAFGAGAAALVVGAATWAASLGQISDLRARCPNGSCPAAAQPTWASAGRLADASTVAFVVGGAALVTGVVLVVLRPGRGRSDAPAPVQVGLGPRGAFITGRF